MGSLSKASVVRFSLFAGVALLALVAVLSLGSPVRSVRLPSGRVIRLESYHFQKGAVHYVRRAKPLARVVARILPDVVTRRIPWLRPDREMIDTNPFRGEPFLSCEFVWENGATYENGPGTRVIVIDAQGQSFDPVANNVMGSVFDVFAFPRRGRELRLQLIDNGNGDHRLAEFTIPNPSPGPHPVWKSQPLPLTVTNGLLEVTLTKFVADLPHSRTWCEFRVRSDGRESRNWSPGISEVSDATGNHWQPSEATPFNQPDDGCVRTDFLGALWPGEDAWKLLVHFSPSENRPGLAPATALEFLAKPEFVGTNQP